MVSKDKNIFCHLRAWRAVWRRTDSLPASDEKVFTLATKTTKRGEEKERNVGGEGEGKKRPDWGKKRDLSRSEGRRGGREERKEKKNFLLLLLPS